MITAAPKRAIITARLSKTVEGHEDSVQDQLEDGRDLAKARGWVVVEEVVERVSAAKAGKRPDFERVLRMIADGQAEVIIGRAWDRLTRNRREEVALIEACEQHQVILAFTRGMDIDLTTGAGQLVADTLASVARHEIREKADRSKRANLRRAMQGKHFGTRRCFGYELDGVTIREPEAQAIREAYELILSGGTLREIARRWNEASLLTPQKGNPWTGTVVGRTLRTTRLAGFREYHGQIVTGPDGEPIKAEWPAIVDPETWAAAQTILADPSRKTTPTHYSRQLLSGVALCADCGRTVQAGGRRNGKPRYRCSGKGGHAMREAEPIDWYIEKLIMARLAEPDAQELLVPTRPKVDVAAIRAEAAQLHTRKDQLSEAFASGVISISQLTKGTEKIDAMLADLEARMPHDTQSAAVAKMITAADPEAVWAALSTDARRGVVDALMTVRLVSPKAAGLHGYIGRNGSGIVNPATVLVEWKA